MLIEIIKRTPPWVFVLFIVLVALGYYQSRNRTVGQKTIAILPAVMIVLSLLGVFSAFGTGVAGLVSWAAGILFSVGLGIKLNAPRGVTFCIETKSYFVPGSWVPLALMMGIFFTKYAVGVTLARQLPIVSEPAFVSSISFCYGVFSGFFLSRAVVVWRSARLSKI